MNSQSTVFHWARAADALDVPLYIIILITFILGYVIGLLYYWVGSLSGHIKHHKEKRALEKHIQDLENELEDLKQTHDGYEYNE